MRRPPIHFQLPAGNPVPAGPAGDTPAAGRVSSPPPAPPSADTDSQVASAHRGRPDQGPTAPTPNTITVHGVGDCPYHGLYRATFGCPGCLQLARDVEQDTTGRQPITIGGPR